MNSTMRSQRIVYLPYSRKLRQRKLTQMHMTTYEKEHNSHKSAQLSYKKHSNNVNTEIKKTKFAERLSFFLKENYNENRFIDVQPVSLASFKTSVMPAALQPALIRSQPSSDCRNSYTFLITLACSSSR